MDHISFAINSKEKVALIGNNGTGKSTIFKLILKEEEPTLMQKEDKVGDIQILGSLKIGYLDQNAIKDTNKTVYEELLSCFEKTMEIEKRFLKISEQINEQPNNHILLEKYDETLKKYEENNGYTYQNDINEMLNRFGFDESYRDRIISSLSGGERMKVAFAKILLFKYDLLLLDEPTNHLDISTIEWLEKFLKSYHGTILFITHDRYFLESLATKILDLENHKVTTYNMDYNHYLETKKARYESLLKEAKVQEAQIEKLKRFIEYYKPKPRFTSRAKDKEKKLARLEKEKVVVEKKSKTLKFNIEGSNLKNKKLMDIKDLVIGYETPLCPPFTFSLYGQDKLAVCGDNGIGKTTLIKTITSQISSIFGEINEVRPLKFGYIRQNDYDFEGGQTPLDYMRNKYPLYSDNELRKHLGQFLFSNDDVFKDIASLSNGEKTRLMLCALSLSDYDVLFLDEPTNHLDMVTKESLIEALHHYSGCIVFISHDRYFINQLATHVLYLSKNQVIYREGDYNVLRKTLDLIEEKTKLKNIKEIENPVVKKREKLSNNALIKLQNEMETIEKRIDEIDEELSEDFESYEIIDKLNDEKEELEFRYLEIIDILEKDKKL